jgi:phosphoribosylamine--glycine ligase
MMKVLIVGNGGREHAIAWKVAKNPKVEKIYCAPGNGGTALCNKCENVNTDNVEKILCFAVDKNIDMTIVGPEAYLVDGIVDMFKEKGLKILGPDREAAMLEGSKIYAKNFMKKYGVKTAGFEVFQDVNSALNYVKSCEYPIVIKADGLAAGKGVVICENVEMAEETLEKFMVKDIFKGSGKKIIIEEYLEGVEASVLSITDGETIIPFISAKDHKQIFDGGKGPNTGGMGAVAPNPYFNEKAYSDFQRDILTPTLNGIKNEGFDYKGIIFFGLMITKKGVYLLEYNVRMGDPETQAVLPLMESDFVELVEKALNKELKNYKVKWSDEFCCSLVAASKGYPMKYETGYEIKGAESIKDNLFAAGAKLIDGKLLTSGGRVLNVWAKGKTLDEAREKAYKNIKNIDFNGMYYRKDIGR